MNIIMGYVFGRLELFDRRRRVHKDVGYLIDDLKLFFWAISIKYHIQCFLIFFYQILWIWQTLHLKYIYLHGLKKTLR